jgi:predicted metal-dependent hydrolase
MEEVRYGNRTLAYTVQRSARRTLAIEVHPDQCIHVVAPLNTSLELIRERVARRGAWIMGQHRYFAQFLPGSTARAYVSGETHRYLGRSYVLKVRQGPERAVKLRGGELLVTAPTKPDAETTKRLLTAWYHAHAQRVFAERLAEALPLFKRHRVEQAPLQIKRMAKRWGSCTAKGHILLNPELIKAPTRCIDYVLIHELCHRVHPQHDKAFYTLQARLMPDWARWKDRLEKLT